MSVRGVLIILIACVVYLVFYLPDMDKWFDNVKQYFKGEDDENDEKTN